MEDKRDLLMYQEILMLRRALELYAEQPDLSEEEFREASELMFRLKLAAYVELG